MVCGGVHGDGANMCDTLIVVKTTIGLQNLSEKGVCGDGSTFMWVSSVGVCG